MRDPRSGVRRALDVIRESGPLWAASLAIDSDVDVQDLPYEVLRKVLVENGQRLMHQP